MTQPQIEILLIASITAISCSVVGVFLVLRRMSLMSDAISHAILLGVVLMFFAVESTASFPMILAAASTGVLTVALVESLSRTRLVAEDSAIGLVFPALFSLGVILVSRYAGDVHLDIDAVLLGELAFAPFDRFEFGAYDLGPKTLWLSSSVAIINVLLISLFYKELKLATFDADLAAALGFAPALIHYALMTVVSVTAVSSFEAVGSVLVVALMITPAAAAHQLTDRLPIMLLLSAIIAVFSAVSGYLLARVLDASIAGSMATMAGVIFSLVVLFGPQRGLVANWVLRRHQRRQFAGEMLVVHLSQHEDSPEEITECSIEHLTRHMKWHPVFASQVVAYLTHRQMLRPVDDGRLRLTPKGRRLATEVMLR